MARTSITLVLELDEPTGSPAGSARLPDGTSREFHGWLGLTEAIDSLARPNDQATMEENGDDTETQ